MIPPLVGKKKVFFSFPKSLAVKKFVGNRRLIKIDGLKIRDTLTNVTTS